MADWTPLRDRYQRGDFGVGERGKHFRAYQQGTNVVRLSPEVAAVFPTEEAVNQALRGLIQKPECTLQLSQPPAADIPSPDDKTSS